MRRYLLLGLPLVFLFAASNIDQQLAKWKPVKMPLNSAGLSAREKQLVSKLVEAGQAMEAVYWEQMDPEGLRLLHSTQDASLKRFLQINGGRWDLLNGNAPFGGAGPVPPGHALYPAGWTRERIETL